MAHLTSLLAYTLCPISMGLMVWLLMRLRPTRRQPADSSAGSSALLSSFADRRTADGLQLDHRLAALRAQLAAVHSEQTAIQVEIDRLARGSPSTARAGAEPGEIPQLVPPPRQPA